MQTIQSFYQYRSLSMAAYGENFGAALDLVNSLKEAGFTTVSAQKFIADGWKVISQSEDSLYGAGGFSATLFHNTKTNEFVFANRGTAGAQDLWVDGWGISLLGIAQAQEQGDYFSLANNSLGGIAA